jgi:nucleoside-diphosphate-sugar epimerase
MNILMTGATGFVGQNLKSHILLNKIGTVRNLNLREELPSYLPVADALIHLAGKAHDLKKSGNDEEYFQVNYEKSRFLFDLFLKSEIKDFIYFSSVKAVADSVTGTLLEDVDPHPSTPYGISKLKAEEYILNKVLTPGKRIFILRPCMIHGPGNKGNLNALYKLVAKGIPYPLGAFKNKRSFLSMANLAFVIECLLKDQFISGGVYNVSDDLPLATTEVIDIIGRANKTKPKIWNISASAIVFMAKLGDKLNLPLNTERLTKLTESYVVSNEKIKAALNIYNMPISSSEGLLNTIKSFKNNN